jgi:hypothetical protein
VISGLYKVCLGFQLATFLGSLRERFGLEESPPPLPDAAAFHAGLEEQALLIGEAEVCAGSAAMIMQAYEVMTDGRAVAEETLGPACAGLEIDWERFDDFTQHVAAIWNDLTLYVLRTPGFAPRLTDPRLPPEVRRRLNERLRRRATQLLEGQRGLVVDIARAAQDYCGRPAEWSGQAAPSPSPQPGGLAATVLTWLGETAGTDMQTHAPVVASALQSQLGPYEAYEATVLGELNRHLDCLMQARGLGAPGPVLTASALSHVCGRTLRDWSDAPT